jgi:hypothetical protein
LAPIHSCFSSKFFDHRPLFAVLKQSATHLLSVFGVLLLSVDTDWNQKIVFEVSEETKKQLLH